VTEFNEALIDNPILNSPYFEPEQHWRLDEETMTIVGDPVDGRRPSSYLTPIPGAKLRRGTQYELVEVAQEETIRRNQLINEIRAKVKAWRTGERPWDGVAPTTRKLLEHWAVVEGRELPLFYAQREAIETAVWLTEVAPKEAAHILTELAQFGQAVSDGLPRVAHKMATGTGKTVLMSLIIAYHTINKARNPQDARFADQFLVVSPGITIRDRLRVLAPSEPDNYYDLLHLVPPSMRDDLNRASVVIINYHQLMLRQKANLTSGTKKVLGKAAENFVETEAEMVARVLRPFGRRKTEIIVLNDEAHHCYRTRPENVLLDPDVARRGYRVVEDPPEEEDEGEKTDDEEARVWHSGLVAVNRHRGIKTVYDLSATPFYISGSGWPEGTLYQWVVSDFPLIEAVESGLVKIPRVPVRDDVDHDDPAFRSLWEKVGPALRQVRAKEAREGEPVIPAELEGAFRALYDDYQAHYHDKMDGVEEDSDITPPVFIVVADTTDRSNYLFRWMTGWRDAEARFHHGVATLFDNVVCDNPDHARDTAHMDNIVCAEAHNPRFRSRPVSLLIDSVALDQPGAQFPKAFQEAAESELERFRAEYRARKPGDQPEDAEILREVMNTVGKPGRLGAPIRLVVSVSMLTEGWDANTVTHILGVRASSTQLICEQVVGRALRRVSYEVDQDMMFSPEYADVYGVPWKLIPTAGKREKTEPPNPAVSIYPVPERRERTEITFPRVVGYRVQPPDEEIEIEEFDDHARLIIEQATWAEVVDVTGYGSVASLDELKKIRPQQVAFDLAHRITDQMTEGRPRAGFDPLEEAGNGKVLGSRPWLFPQVLGLVRRWLDECLVLKGNAFRQLVLLSQHRSEAVQRILGQIANAVSSNGKTVMLPILDPASSVGSTGHMQPWKTTRPAEDIYKTDESKCHINRLVAHSSWEKRFAQQLEALPEANRYVKNDHLDFTIPYVLDGIARSYIPDFIVHLEDGDDDTLQVIVEISGQKRREKGIKTMTAATRWTNAINGDGRFGQWSFVELKEVDADTPRLFVEKAREHHERYSGSIQLEILEEIME